MGNERFVSKRGEFLGRCLISFSFDQDAALIRLGVVRCRRVNSCFRTCRRVGSVCVLLPPCIRLARSPGSLDRCLVL